MDDLGVAYCKKLGAASTRAHQLAAVTIRHKAMLNQSTILVERFSSLILVTESLLLACSRHVPHSPALPSWLLSRLEPQPQVLSLKLTRTGAGLTEMAPVQTNATMNLTVASSSYQ